MFSATPRPAPNPRAGRPVSQQSRPVPNAYRQRQNTDRARNSAPSHQDLNRTIRDRLYNQNENLTNRTRPSSAPHNQSRPRVPVSGTNGSVGRSPTRSAGVGAGAGLAVGGLIANALASAAVQASSGDLAGARDTLYRELVYDQEAFESTYRDNGFQRGPRNAGEFFNPYQIPRDGAEDAERSRQSRNSERGWYGGGQGGTDRRSWADRARDFFFPSGIPNRARPGAVPPRDVFSPVPPPPPFQGGQENTVYYVSVDVVDTWVNFWGNTQQSTTPAGQQVYGPVYAVRSEIRGERIHFEILCHGMFGNGLQQRNQNPVWHVLADRSTSRNITFENFNLTRTDGQPDTAGNPEPLPGTPSPGDRAPTIGPNRPQPNNRPSSPLPPMIPLPGAAPAPTRDPRSAPGRTPNPLGQPARSPRWNPFRGPSPAPQPSTPSRPNQPTPNTPGNRSLGGNPRGYTNPSSGSDFRTTTVTSGGGRGPCFYDFTGPQILAKQEQANTMLNTVNTLLSGTILTKVNGIDNKLGPQLPGGGISTFLQGFRQFTEKVWKATQMDRVLSLMTTFLALHNALLLSRNAVETIGDLLSQGLALIGLKDEENNPIDINGIVGKSIKDKIIELIGQKNYNDVVTGWAKFSTIYNSAANIIYTLRSIADSARSITEWTAENTGRIGNALKRWGVLGESAYPWMAENVTAMTPMQRRIQRMAEGIDRVEDTASSIHSVVSDARTIQDEVQEVRTQKAEFDNHLATAFVKPAVANAPIGDAHSEYLTGIRRVLDSDSLTASKVLPSED
jgi:ElaB/YqjD/DUF883 family membrane-anchored ribosome-binding protein